MSILHFGTEIDSNLCVYVFNSVFSICVYRGEVKRSL